MQALGGALAVTASLELLPAAVGSERRATAVWATAGATGAALGPAVGGILTQLVSWQSIFLLQVPIALAAAVPILTVARHEMSTRVIERELRRDRPAAPLGERGAGDGLGLDRGGALPPRPAADRRLAPQPDRRRDRRLGDAAGGGARLAGLAAGSRTSGPAPRPARSSLAGGLGGLALLPKAEVALTLPPQILIGIGLSLVLSALTETALSGRAPQAIHGGWTISARHAGVVIGLLALTPVFTHDIAVQQKRRDQRRHLGDPRLADPPAAEARPGEEDLRPPRTTRTARCRTSATSSTRCPKTKANAAEVVELREELQDQLDRGATHAFSPSFGIAALIGLLALIPIGLARRIDL